MESSRSGLFLHACPRLSSGGGEVNKFDVGGFADQYCGCPSFGLCPPACGEKRSHFGHVLSPDVNIVSYTINRLASPWTPWAIALPFLLFLWICAFLSMGKIGHLPIVIILGSFLIQTHVGVVPVVLSLIIASFISCVFTEKLWTEEKRRRLKYALASALIAVLAMWALPVYEEITNYPGNLSRIFMFFTHPRATAGWEDALYRISVQLSWILPSLPDIPRFEYELLALLFAGAQLLGLVFIFIKAGRQGEALRARISLLGIVAILVACWAASKIEGDIFDYLVFWLSSLGCLNLSLFLAALYEYLEKRTKFISATAKPVFLGIFFALIIACLSQFVINLPKPTQQSRIELFSAALIKYLKDHQITRPVFLFNWSHWTTDASLILQLHKKHIPFATRNGWSNHHWNWPLLLGRKYRPSTEDDNLIIVTEKPINNSQFLVVAEFNKTFIYIKESEPKPIN